MIELRGYIDERGKRRFADWLDTLNATAAAKVTIALARMEYGNLANVKGVGAGVFEYRIDFGPGYRTTSARTETASSSWLVAERRNANHRTSQQH